MKKFLSLLLTLTMVLSLAVVPARAADLTGSVDGTLSVKNGNDAISSLNLKVGDAAVTLTAEMSTGAKLMLDDTEATVTSTSYVWSVTAGTDVVDVTADGGVVTVKKAGPATIHCIATLSGTILTKDVGEESPTSKNISGSVSADISVNVTDPSAAENAKFQTAAAAALTFKYNDRIYTPASNGTVTAYKYDGEAADNWAVTVSDSLSAAYDNVSAPTTSGNKVTITAKTKVPDGTGGTPINVKAEFTLAVETASFGIKSTINGQVTANTVIAGGKVALATENAVLPSSGVSYEWKYIGAAQGSQSQTINNTSASFDWTVPANLTADTYTVSCTAKSSDTVVATATNTLTITVIADNWALYPTTLNTINLAVGQSAPLPTVELYSKVDGKQGTKVADLRYDWTSNSARIFVDTATGKVTALSGASGDYKLTVSTTYQGKTYSKEVTVRVSSLSATLSSVSNGDSARTYYISDMMSSARTLIAQRVNKNVASVTVSSLTFKSETANLGGSFSRTRATTSSGYITYTAPKATLGKAAITYTAQSSEGTFDITYYIPVIPIATTFTAQYPQVSASGSNYTYVVSAPSGYDRIALVNKTGSTPSVDTLAAPTLGNNSTITLNSSDFNSTTGKCTLYVIAWNSNYSYSYSYNSGKYYSGPLEVYLQSNDIEYTGVAGSTVNFQHSSFTAFLNSMNTSSNTYYYEFQDVTFSYFNSSTQGTLYYGSTAMTSGSYSSSSYFNSATKITNLDNVSFAIKSTIPASVKTISIPFQLHAKQYRSGSYSSSFVSDVTFSGRVVISVAREDIVINVAAGDAVKLDATAFLNYLRNSSTSYRNANIDYVTFSQNLSVSSSNSAYTNGALYTYYTNSYSFGNPVTSTDRFYYSTTTYNVNRLSDVAFRANTYATAGTTVYIPFTIKLLNSNATVTGTLAAKIANAVNFYDVTPGAYYYDAVKWAVGAGVTKGTGNNMFSPAKSCTRAEIVTFLWRAAGSPAPKRSSSPFTDVYSSMGSDFYNAILWAVGEGITTGTTTSKFSPNDTCTRGQIVTFLHRYLKTPSGYYSNPFKDIKSGYYCYNAVIWAYGSGVAKGTSATTFSPDATCTRGDAVTFLYRALVK